MCRVVGLDCRWVESLECVVFRDGPVQRRDRQEVQTKFQKCTMQTKKTQDDGTFFSSSSQLDWCIYVHASPSPSLHPSAFTRSSLEELAHVSSSNAVAKTWCSLTLQNRARHVALVL